jgi:hypothetical protein
MFLAVLSCTKVFGEHEENSPPMTNLDKWILVNSAAHKYDGGSCWNGYYYPIIRLRQNGSTSSFQSEDVSPRFVLLLSGRIEKDADQTKLDVRNTKTEKRLRMLPFLSESGI